MHGGKFLQNQEGQRQKEKSKKNATKYLLITGLRYAFPGNRFLSPSPITTLLNPANQNAFKFIVRLFPKNAPRHTNEEIRELLEEL